MRAKIKAHWQHQSEERMVTPEKFAHYMLKEVFDQPRGLRDTFAPRLSPDNTVLLNELRIERAVFEQLKRIRILGSGTSRHAGIVGQYMLQDLAAVPADVEYASEFEYRNPLIDVAELTVVITQSGETADTSAAQRDARAKGSKTIAITNVPGSTIAREADGALYTHAGPEISIASTKAFTAQMAVLFLFSVYLARIRGVIDKPQEQEWVRRLLEIPDSVQKVLEQADRVQRLADTFHKFDDFLFMGRAVHYPVSMDGALKLKEVSYAHAEGYPTGEVKHGPKALIDENLPVVMLATCDPTDHRSVHRREKNLADIHAYKAQAGRVIVIATDGDEEIGRAADHAIYVPKAAELLSPILEIVPLQLFAYYIAVRRGLDVDRPRNLVKAVTTD